MRLGGLQSWCGLCGEEKNSQPPPGIEPPIIQPVAQLYTTKLPYHIKYIYVPNKSGDIYILCSVLVSLIVDLCTRWK
jgi:hypothetical protein